MQGTQFPGAKPYKLSESCRDVYIELDKQWQYGTKFYLASPCSAQLEITWGECNCFPEKVQIWGKDMIVCSQDQQYKDYKSKCIKIKPRAIQDIDPNFCYTPPQVFGQVASGLSIGSSLAFKYVCPGAALAGGVPGVACYAITGIGQIAALKLQSMSAWPHGFLEQEQGFGGGGAGAR